MRAVRLSASGPPESIRCYHFRGFCYRFSRTPPIRARVQAIHRTRRTLPEPPAVGAHGQLDARVPELLLHVGGRHAVLEQQAGVGVPQAGKVITQTHRRHRAKEFRGFLDCIDAEVPDDLDVHLVMDHLSTHKSPTIRRWLASDPRFHVHFTPTYGSWLNQVERWFGLLEQRQLKRGSHRSVVALVKAIGEFVEVSNEKARPFRWVKTADEILASIARFAQRTIRVHA